MRKLFSVFLILALLVSVLALNSNAVLKMKKGTASYGTPSIDGVMDECYSYSKEIVIEYMCSMANNATDADLPNMAKGVARLCWDENAVYLYLEVTDRTPVTQPLSNYSSDACELIMDFDNMPSDSSGYGDNGIFVKTLPYASKVGSPEYEIEWPGLGTVFQNWLTGLPANEHPLACVIKSDGYIIERKIPLNDAVKAMVKPGFSFGFQIWLLDDIDDNNQRDFKVSWGESTDDVAVSSSGVPATCDELTLIEAPPPPVIEVVGQFEVATDGAVSAVTLPAVISPQTGDAAILLSFISLISAGGLAVLRIKKKK